MKLLPIAIISGVASFSAALHGATTHAHPEVFAPSATLVSVSQYGKANVLALRGDNAKISFVTVPAGAAVLTRNGARIASSDLRLGDQVAVAKDGTVRDLSQESTVLTGVVAYAPTTVNDVITVQLSPTRTVLVNVDPRTRFADRTQSTSSVTDILDSDTVAVHGVLDTTMDEVVSSQVVERLGPKLTRSYTSG